ncbi:MAG: AraC family transcriptional regulator [Oscillospiraceae bacterium]
MFDFKANCFCNKMEKVEISTEISYKIDAVILAVLTNGDCEVNKINFPTQEFSAPRVLLLSAPLNLNLHNDSNVLYATFTGDFVKRLQGEISGAVDLGGENVSYYKDKLVQLGETLKNEGEAANSKASYAILCDSAAQIEQSSVTLPPLVAEAMKRIQENFAQLYGVEELALQMNVTREHLVRVFHENLGITPGQYLTKIKIKYEKQILQNREYTLEVIASLCGFAGANYFCKVFKKQTGQTPMQYRRLNASIAPFKGQLSDAEDVWYSC